MAWRLLACAHQPIASSRSGLCFHHWLRSLLPPRRGSCRLQSISRPTQCLLGSFHSCHNQRSRKTLVNFSKFGTPRPPCLVGMHVLVQLTLYPPAMSPDVLLLPLFSLSSGNTLLENTTFRNTNVFLILLSGNANMLSSLISVSSRRQGTWGCCGGDKGPESQSWSWNYTLILVEGSSIDARDDLSVFFIRNLVA